MSLTPKLLSFAVLMALGGAAAAANTTNSPAVSRALGLLQNHGAAVHASPQDRFIARDVMVDRDGTEHVRFDRTYAGLPVIGGDFVTHSRGGQLHSTSLTQGAALKLGTRPTLDQSEAIVRAGAAFGSDFVGTPKATLVVYARDTTPKLAYQVTLQGADKNGNDLDMTFIVDAKLGNLLDRWSNHETAAATATFKTLFSGNVSSTTNSITGGYEMRDPSRGNGYTVNGAKGRNSGKIYTDTDNVWGNNSTSDGATAAADAQFGVAVTWDYYKNVHGRTGIANNGAGAYNKVHYGNNYVNAYWSDSCFCMTYGDGDGVSYAPLVTLDIAGHEMSHGVMSRTANLTYSGESGGLNEANSDIMGTMVEFYANNSIDVADYLVGEEIYIANVPGSASQKALRYMYNPIKDTRSPNCYSSTIGSLDVHYSSGVANHFFYLLAEGSGAKTYNGVDHTSTTCNSTSITGIGRADAEAIWYKATSTYMTSNTNYAGARAATLSAATALFGAGSPQYSAVAAAWSAVNVN
jgi:Zn-dependent metalloprotease